jgi:hypothetical protein
MPIIPALMRLRQEDYEFKFSMDYIMRCCLKKKPKYQSQAPIYSGGRDQEGHSLKAARANSSVDPISKNPSQK